jgi:hypothetical protein
MSFETSQGLFAQALLDPARQLPAGITNASGKADPLRFAVYRNNVFVGLTGALAKRFTVVRRLVGEEFFTGMARVYAGLEKPASPVMFEYGEGFADFIAGFPPAHGLVYLADVARVEAAWTRAYHAADVETLGVGELAALPPEEIEWLRLKPHAAATLISSSHPAGSIWAAHQGDDIGQVRAQPETILVVRPATDVSVNILPARDAVFARAVFNGEALGDAAGSALAQDTDFDFGSALVGLASLGAFAIFQKDNQR